MVVSGVAGTSEITATLRSRHGTRLPDMPIYFMTTAGVLDPPAGTDLLTDQNGEATSTLTTARSAIVQAFSSGASGKVRVTVPVELAQFVLHVEPTELYSCNDIVTLTAQVRTTAGEPVENIAVIFNEVPPKLAARHLFAKLTSALRQERQGGGELGSQRYHLF